LAGGQVHLHAFPATLPFGIREEATQYFHIEIALALKVAVKPSMGQARACHDLLERHSVKSMPVE
jgi:hypothetical protein